MVNLNISLSSFSPRDWQKIKTFGNTSLMPGAPSFMPPLLALNVQLQLPSFQDRALLLGIDKDDASFLLSVVGIANTIGRIVLVPMA
jgi:hypothetical protein